MLLLSILNRLYMMGSLEISALKNYRTGWGAWVALSVKHLTSAQVMVSQLAGLSLTSGSLLSAQSPLQILCPTLCLSASLTLCLSLKNKH